MPKRFPRGTIWSEEGSDPAEIVTARVVAANYVNYTVDVVTQMDQKRHFGIPVGSPYLHPQNGEGIYVMPEVGAWCRVGLPSDTTPPFVLCFVMPSRLVEGGGQSKGAVTEFANNASFSGNRGKWKGGDIILRGRDENFVVLHRGGVLQLGSSPLCQSVYLPLGNLLRDVSGRYEHLNSGGSISWGLQDGVSTDPPAEYRQVFRVLGGSKYADIKLAVGTVLSPYPETPAQSLSDLSQLGIGTSPKDPIVYELVVTPGGYGDSGDLQPGVTNRLRIFFDQAGGGMLRTEGSVLVAVKKKLRFRVGGDIEFFSGGSITLEAGGDVSFRGGGSLGVSAGLVRLNGGGSPVARQGDIVQVILPFTPVPASPTPLSLSGVILTGNSTVLG